MATFTSEDKYIQSKCTEIKNVIQQFSDLAARLESEKSKARGGTAESLYLEVVKLLSWNAKNNTKAIGTYLTNITTHLTNKRAY